MATARTADLLSQVIDALDAGFAEATELELVERLSIDVELTQALFQNSAERLLKQYQNGNLTAIQLRRRLIDRFSDSAEAAFRAGKRSRGIHKIQSEEMKLLRREIERDLLRMRQVPVAAWKGRVPLYAARLHGFGQLGRLYVHLRDYPGGGGARWETGKAEHCADCLELRDGGPYSAAELADLGLYPGSGFTRCGSNCKCTLIEDDTGDARSIPISRLGGYRVKR